jgi:cytochrome c oxidase cbb3-type subunit III
MTSHPPQERMMESSIRIGLLLISIVLFGTQASHAQGKPGSAPEGVTPAAIAQGDSVFHKSGNCYACHGANGQGVVGPNLTDAEWIHGDGSYEMIVATVTKGITKEEAKGGVPMPPKGGSTITDEQVKQVAAYVWSLSHKTGQ